MKKTTKKAEPKMGAVDRTFLFNGKCTICGGTIGTDDNLNIYSTSDCPHYPKY